MMRERVAWDRHGEVGYCEGSVNYIFLNKYWKKSPDEDYSNILLRHVKTLNKHKKNITLSI